MDVKDFIVDMLDNMDRALLAAVNGLNRNELAWRPETEANSIGFTLWHQVRCEDIFIQAMLQRKPQVWESEKWHQKLSLPENPRDIGYGYTAEQVAAFPIPDLQGLLGYAQAVRSRTVECVKSMPPEKFDAIVRAGPLGEASVGRVLSHLLCEITRHIGQIAYLRGLQRGLNK